MSPARRNDRNSWVREGLKAKGYSQRDLARAWGVAEPSISRFISGEEGVDPPLSRCMTLARMLDITLEDLANGLGMKGRQVEPTITADAGLPSVGTFKMDIIEPGRVRVVMVQDVTPDVASKLVTAIGGGA